MFNDVILSGRLGKIDTLKLYGDVDDDTCCCFFDVASSSYSKKTEEQYTDWIHCKAWGNQAKRFVNNAANGMLVEVRGRLKNETYNDQERTYVIVTSFRLYKTTPCVDIDENKLDKVEI